MKTSLTLISSFGKAPFVGQGTGLAGKTLLRKFARRLEAIFHGEGQQGRLVFRPYVVAGTQCANAVVTLASVSNADTVTINGAALTAANGSPTADQFDMSLSTDTLVAGDLVRALNASTTSLISDHVRATNKQAIVTCATVAINDWVDIAGVRLFAKNGTANSTTGLLINEFSMSGSDTQDGHSLGLAINQHPTLSQIVYATDASGVVTVWERPLTTGQTIPISTSSGSTLAITGSATSLATSASVFIESVIPGVAGNAVTLATNNGTRLAITLDNSGRLKNGASSTYTY